MKCSNKQDIKYIMKITLGSKISNSWELNNIIKLILTGLFVEDYNILSRYKTCCEIKVIEDVENKRSAIISIEGNTIIASSDYQDFCKKIHNRIVEILEVEND